VLINLDVQLETRESLNDKSGNVFYYTPPTTQSISARGKSTLKSAPGQNLVVAKITIQEKGKARSFYFYKQLPKNKSPYLIIDQHAVLNSYINPTKKGVTFEGFASDKPLHISYYNVSFPLAAPAFSNSQAKVSKTLKPDSVFNVVPTEFTKKGLYLVQQDTSSAEGVAFRVEEDYPKLNTIESLAGPLIYICTKQEAEKLKQVGNDKKKFDQLILTITGNSERARTFMRSYYRRIELANQYFSSYKEGWKTDRGMIYTIFGLPEEVYLFDDREVWDYQNSHVKIRFQFVRSPSLFDPDNYVLIRDKKFTTPWYEMIDLWRKARF
jgi:GWxTD domain-containing protein